MYTPGFAPPELYSKTGNVGPWTDIYGVGASIFACLAGIPPQPWDQRKMHDKMGAYLEKLEGAFTAEILGVVESCLKIDHLERPQSLFELQKSLVAPVDSTQQKKPQAKSLSDKFLSLFGKNSQKESGPTIVSE